jgi:hypothetical protein
MGTFLLWLISACTHPTIEGVVVDAAGQPLSTVNVTVSRADCSDVSNAEGHFSLTCKSSALALTLTHPEFFTKKLSLVAPEGATHRLPKTTLVRIPKADGLFIFKDQQYIGLDGGVLKRNTETQGTAKRRSYCLDRSLSTANPIAAGRTRFADKNAKPWRLFKLDALGCAYRDARDTKGRWVVEYRDRPALSRETADDGLAILEGTLDEGEYFVADWGGFFVADPPGKGHYTGRWIRVDG